MNIRGNTISFASWKKRQALQKERELEEKIIEIEELLHKELSLVEEHKLTSLNNYNRELDKLGEDKGKGAILRAKVRWLDAGENPSK